MGTIKEEERLLRPNPLPQFLNKNGSYVESRNVIVEQEQKFYC